MTDLVQSHQCPLTPRQIECIRWASVGKTHAEISKIIGVSPFTVYRFFQDARERADAVNLPSLVAKSLRAGWIN